MTPCKRRHLFSWLLVSLSILAPATVLAQATGSVVTAPLSRLDDPLQEQGPRFFAGVVLAPGFSVGPNTLAATVALRGGVMLGRTELGLELAPKTFTANANFHVADGSPYVDQYFSLLATAAHYFPLGRSRVYWPLRFGIGFATMISPGDVLLHARVDLFGLAFSTRRLVFDFALPSYRLLGFGGYHALLASLEIRWVFRR